MSKITFNNKSNPFFKSLKEKVDHYFDSKDLSLTGNTHLYIKCLIQISTAATFYILLVFFTPSVWLSLVLCAALGVNLSLLGFNVMHEGGHQSFSKYKWLNSISSYFLNALGGSSLFWKIKHNINHHTYTNIEGMDTDIEVRPFMRLHENQERYWFHRFQHIYWVILYGSSYFAWIFVNDFYKYFSGNVAPGNEGKKLDKKEHYIFWVTKIAYIAMYIGLPIFLLGFVNTLVGFSVMAFACGLSIAIVFQLAHVVEDTSFPETSDTNKIDQEWAIHQIQTTANFSTRNKTLSWFLGGLNFQVEHHLFPRISHVHYPAINQMVKQTCAEFNIEYLEYPSLFSAFYSHLNHIRKLGNA